MVEFRTLELSLDKVLEVPTRREPSYLMCNEVVPQERAIAF